MSKKKIGFIVGSLREGSYNLKIAKVFATLLPEAYEASFIEIGELPFYNEDLETPEHVPAAWTTFREELAAVEGVIFFTPEYNRSMPGALKNALDVGSRPYGASQWDKKTAAVVSSSIGAISGFGANHHLRQSLVFLNMPTLAQPEAYIAQANTLFNEAGDLINEGTKDFFQSIVDAYLALHEQLNK